MRSGSILQKRICEVYGNPRYNKDGGNTYVKCQGQRQSQFDFYASDAPNTTYLITIEGISQDGTPIRSIHQVTKR